jgi:hypothetical protein
VQCARYTTAAYLTYLTAATANKGCTPYELWFGRVPSLSHLCEIGCKAFALINPSPSKIYARSLPCVLIGYAPHSKAYRLWDPVSSHVFNSFHVSFAEHLDTLDTLPFRPGTVLGTAMASYPPSWDVSGPAPPEPVVPTQCLHNYDNFFSPLPSIADQSPVSAHFPSIMIPSDMNIPKVQSINNAPHQNTVTQQNNTVIHQNNTIPHQNNTVPPQNNTVPPQNNTIPPQAQNNTVSPQATTSHPHIDTASQQNNNVSPQNTISQLNNNPAVDPPPLTITIPPRPALRRSARLQALHNNNDQAFAFLSHYSSLRDTHDLFPLDITLDAPEPSVDHMLTALSDGSIEPVPADKDNEPLWEHAMASDEREYWIAGRRDELNSLQDLKVFVLVPHSEVPHGHRPLQGKLVCKHKCDDTGKIVHYKVRYVAKGFAQ